VDESVCHLQDGSFQISLGREGAVPVWLGMGWLETKSRKVPQSERYYSTPGPETVRARTESSRITHSLHLDPICVTTI